MTPEQRNFNQNLLDKVEQDLSEIGSLVSQEKHLIQNVLKMNGDDIVKGITELASKQSDTHPLAADLLPKLYGYAWVAGEKIPLTMHQNLVDDVREKCQNLLNHVSKDSSEWDVKHVRKEILKLLAASSSCRF